MAGTVRDALTSQLTQSYLLLRNFLLFSLNNLITLYRGRNNRGEGLISRLSKSSLKAVWVRNEKHFENKTKQNKNGCFEISWAVCRVQIIALLHEDSILIQGFDKQALKCKTVRDKLSLRRGINYASTDSAELLERNISLA